MPAITTPRLRALGVIAKDAETHSFELEGRAFTVGVRHAYFPSGGDWAYFVCPCGRRAKTLRLLGERLVCRRCDGLLDRSQMNDKGPALARLTERVYGPPTRVNQWRMKAPVNNRDKLEAALRRKLIVQRQRRLGVK